MTAAAALCATMCALAATAVAPSLQVLPANAGDALSYRYALHGQTSRGSQDAAVSVSLTRDDATLVTIRERGADNAPAPLEARIDGGATLVLHKHVDPQDIPVTLAALDTALTIAQSVPAGVASGATWKATLPAAIPGAPASDFPVTVTATSVAGVALDLHVTGSRMQTYVAQPGSSQISNPASNDFAQPQFNDPNATQPDSGATPAPLHIRTTVDETLHFTDGALSSAQGSVTATGDANKTYVDLAWSLEREHN